VSRPLQRGGGIGEGDGGRMACGMQNITSDKNTMRSRETDIVPFTEPEGPLEPVAIPLSRIGAILRRHCLVVLVTFAVGVGATEMYTCTHDGAAGI